MIAALPQFTILAVFALSAMLTGLAWTYSRHAQDLLAGALPQLVFHLASKRH